MAWSITNMRTGATRSFSRALGSIRSILGGPTAFVRLPDSPVIWRADVGGRARYERPAADWRDKMALDVPRERVRALTLVRGKDDSVRVVRAPSTEVDTDGNPVVGPSQSSQL